MPAPGPATFVRSGKEPTLSTAVQTSLNEGQWSAHRGHVPSLDGLRAVSILIVMAGHLALPGALRGVAALGLDLFFFISGFLITRLMFSEAGPAPAGSVDLPAFYLRRLLRVYPVLLVYLGVCLFIAWRRHSSLNLPEITSVLFYYSNYFLSHLELTGANPALPIDFLWSLSVEEHFYLVAPLVFVALRADAGALARVAVAVCLASLALRLVYVVRWPGIQDTLFIYRHSETRADSIAYGVLLAALCQSGRGCRCIGLLARRPAFAVAAVVLAASYGLRDAAYQNTVRFTIQSLAIAVLVVGVVFAEPCPFVNRVLNTAPLRWVGQISYSLYIWHGGAMFLFGGWAESLPRARGGAILVCLSLGLAIMSHYAIEQPISMLRARLRGRKRAAELAEGREPSRRRRSSRPPAVEVEATGNRLREPARLPRHAATAAPSRPGRI